MKRFIQNSSVLLTIGGLLLLGLLLFPSSQVFAASSQVQRPASNFQQSCFNLYIGDGGLLGASCYRRDRSIVVNNFSLNPHVGNKNGVLVPNGSSFPLTCSNIGGQGNISLVANCRTSFGTFNYTTLNLDPYISNNNGNLVWG